MKPRFTFSDIQDALRIRFFGSDEIEYWTKDSVMTFVEDWSNKYPGLAVDDFLRRRLCLDKDYFPRSMKRNNFSVSFGLVVRTIDHKLMVIRRHIPYCVQNYLHRIRKKNRPYRFDRIQFEREVYPSLNEVERIDYDNYRGGLQFEDVLDFPHGQMQRKDRVLQADREAYLRVAFANAFKEFREETGYVFTYDPDKIKDYPLKRVDFIGNDGYCYSQFYFIVSNPKWLRRVSKYSFNDEQKQERVVYTGYLMAEIDVYRALERQQEFKADKKHLLLIPDLLPDVSTEDLARLIMY